MTEFELFFFYYLKFIRTKKLMIIIGVSYNWYNAVLS